MNSNREVSTHYSRGDLLSRLNAALREDGIDPDHPTTDGQLSSAAKNRRSARPC